MDHTLASTILRKALPPIKTGDDLHMSPQRRLERENRARTGATEKCLSETHGWIQRNQTAESLDKLTETNSKEKLFFARSNKLLAPSAVELPAQMMSEDRRAKENLMALKTFVAQGEVVSFEDSQWDTLADMLPDRLRDRAPCKGDLAEGNKVPKCDDSCNLGCQFRDTMAALKQEVCNMHQSTMKKNQSARTVGRCR